MTSATIAILPGPGPSVRRSLKRWWERAAAALALVVLVPALATIALLVRLDSPGPVLYRQRRAGRGGQPFTMLKFRTMREGADAEVEVLRATGGEGVQTLFKLHDDPRVTALGHWLRRYSLDELPQLVNVVRGEMALVGPRPALLHEVDAYSQCCLRRFSVDPGLTGLWQVSGRSDLGWEESVRIDLDYVDHWSLGRDLLIIARTVGAVLGHRGAY